MHAKIMERSSPNALVGEGPHVGGKKVYRADIDGLRALAIGGVVAFHLWPSGLPGGFVGVDVFFVISGYLITRLLLEESNSGSIDVLAFYQRRVIRLFPALIAVLLFTVVAGYGLLLADEYAELGLQIAAGAMYLSNVLQIFQDGYFEASALRKPLLHLWSLAVEEQYYLLFPLILSFVLRTRRGLLVLLLAIACSFCLWVVLGTVKPMQSYYGLPTRAWQILIGASLNWLHSDDALMSTTRFGRNELQYYPRSEAKVVAGLALVASSYLFLKDSDYPGWKAILPTAGAALLILGGSRSCISRTILGSRPAVYFGGISYPLYLWHWPLLSLTVIVADDATRWMRGAIAITSVGLAALTAAFVEAPVRSRPNGKVVLFLALATIAVAAVGVTIHRSGGFPDRLAHESVLAGEIGQAPFLATLKQNYIPCANTKLLQEILADDPSFCMQAKPGGVDVVLVGDSHAQSIFSGLAAELKDLNVGLYARAGFNRRGFPVDDNPVFSEIFSEIRNDENIRTVIITAYWHFLVAQYKGEVEKFEARLKDTVLRLAQSNKRVILMGDIPDMVGLSPRSCKIQRPWLGREVACSLSRADVDKQVATYLPILERVAGSSDGGHVVNIVPWFCGAEDCSMIHDDLVVYRDPHHLSVEGARRLAKDSLELMPLKKHAASSP